MSLAILFHFIWLQHVSDINISITRSLRLCCCCRLKHASACNTGATSTQPHRISNTHLTKNITTNVVIQQHSRKLLVIDILMSETCLAHKKWNKIASDIQVGLLFFNCHNDARSNNVRCTQLYFPVNLSSTQGTSISIQVYVNYISKI